MTHPPCFSFYHYHNQYIIGVGVIIFHAAHFLQRVNDNQHGVGILFEELDELLLQTFFQNVALRTETNIGRNLVRDTEEPVLDTAGGIFKAEIERSALFRLEIPNGFAFGDGCSQPESQPGFSHLRCACQNMQALGDEGVYHEVQRLHGDAHQGFTVDGVEGVDVAFVHMVYLLKRNRILTSLKSGASILIATE